MNRLSKESSPYLLQHAGNPVDWYPWGDEALSRARLEDKPILVSIGYAACHWCHVMERESFENEATAVLMNENFINIKIDREERPDLDHIYMDAVQAMTGSGGWPLNVFLTPAGKPFYGGTYFPPMRADNRPSWQEVLTSISKMFREKRNEVDAQAENLTAHVLQSNDLGQQLAGGEDLFTSASLEQMHAQIMRAADREWGGFGTAPKFPQVFSIQFLLRNYFIKHTSAALHRNVDMNEVGLRQALLSLDRMLEGGIYDQVGGGFARYSTDTEWLAPHFEKMLYDNALLVGVLAEAYSLTGKERYREVIEETIGFVERELMHPAYGFYSALDADSEGEEGKFYVWSLGEVQEALEKDAAIFAGYYDVSERGNWEGKNILRARQTPEAFALANGHDAGEVRAVLQRGKERLMEVRSGRARPLLDDKIILGWNALMNTALSKAYSATGNEHYRELAVKNMQFLVANLALAGGWRHTWKEGNARYHAFLDDLAFLVEALVQLQEITGDRQWLVKAGELSGQIIEQYGEEDTGFFFFTAKEQQDVILRKKEIYDGAVPSGNATMAVNLFRLSILFDRPEWRDRSLGMVRTLGRAIVKYPTSFGVWGGLLQEMAAGTYELAVVGQNWPELSDELRRLYLPHKVFMGAEKPDDGWPLLRHKEVGKSTSIFLCKDYACKQPVETISRFISLIYNDEPKN